MRKDAPKDKWSLNAEQKQRRRLFPLRSAAFSIHLTYQKTTKCLNLKVALSRYVLILLSQWDFNNGILLFNIIRIGHVFS